MRGDINLQALRKQALIEVISKKEIALIIGSGVTVQATGAVTALWSGILRHGIDHCVAFGNFGLNENPKKWRKTALSMLKVGGTPSLVSVGNDITNKLGGTRSGNWSDWLRKVFISLRVSKPEILRAIFLLSNESEAIVMTTNYDNIISEYFGLSSVTWDDLDAVTDIVTRRKRDILHLHGSWHRPESIVLGERSYDRLIADEFAQVIQKSVAVANSFIFIGCGDGLDDENIGGLITWTNSILERSERQHFILLRSDVARKIRKSGKLIPVSYGDAFENLPAFLSTLRGEPDMGANMGELRDFRSDVQAPISFPPEDFVGMLGEELDKVEGLKTMERANELRSKIDTLSVKVRSGQLPLDATVGNEIFWEKMLRTFGSQSVQAASAALMTLPDHKISEALRKRRNELLNILRVI